MIKSTAPPTSVKKAVESTQSPAAKTTLSPAAKIEPTQDATVVPATASENKRAEDAKVVTF